MIKLMGPTFYKESLVKRELVKFIKKAERLSMGVECEEFEKNFAKFQHRKYAIFVSNGSAANLVLVQALLNLGILRTGNNVGFSALTWPTNVMPLIQLGLNPIPIDCEMETLNVSLEKLKQVKVNLHGLFITNVLGFADNLDAIENYCKQNKITLFEDNCESFGSKLTGKLLGNFGVAATFSFFVGHHLSTIEGGMIVTDNFEVYEMCKLVRAHGWDRNLSNLSQKKIRKASKISDFYSKYTFHDLAYNARPTDINGFIGNIQLKFAKEIIKKREENFRKFHKATLDNIDIIKLNVNHMDLVSNMAFPLVFKTKQLLGKYRKIFEKNEVEIRPLIAGNMVNQPFFKKHVMSSFDNPVKLENVNHIHYCGMYFPNNPELTKQDVKLLCSILKS